MQASSNTASQNLVFFIHPIRQTPAPPSRAQTPKRVSSKTPAPPAIKKSTNSAPQAQRGNHKAQPSNAFEPIQTGSRFAERVKRNIRNECANSASSQARFSRQLLRLIRKELS